MCGNEGREPRAHRKDNAIGGVLVFNLNAWRGLGVWLLCHTAGVAGNGGDHHMTGCVSVDGDDASVVVDAATKLEEAILLIKEKLCVGDELG